MATKKSVEQAAVETQLDLQTVVIPFLRSQFNYDRDAASKETALECKDVSRAIASQLEESDINTIVRRFGLTGELPENVRMPQYGDFTAVTDYQTALNAVKAADEVFAQMPAEVRQRFGNDPELFVEFCLDPKNKDEAIRLGLVEKPVVIGAVPATEPPVPPKAAGIAP